MPVSAQQQPVPVIIESETFTLSGPESTGTFYATGGVQKAVLLAAVLESGVDEVVLQESNDEGSTIAYEWSMGVDTDIYYRLVAEPSCAWIRAVVRSGTSSGSVFITVTLS